MQDFPSIPVVKTPSLNTGGMGLILVGELRSHMPCGLARKKTRMTANGTIIIG